MNGNNKEQESQPAGNTETSTGFHSVVEKALGGEEEALLLAGVSDSDVTFPRCPVPPH